MIHTEASPVEPSPTCHFTPILKGRCVTPAGTLDFWFAADVPTHDLLELWQGWYQVDTHFVDHDRQGIALRLLPNLVQVCEREDHGLINLFQDHMLTIKTASDDNVHQVTQELATWRDQYDSNCKYNTYDGLVFFPHPLPVVGNILSNPAIVMTAMQECQMSYAANRYFTRYHTIARDLPLRLRPFVTFGRNFSLKNWLMLWDTM